MKEKKRKKERHAFGGYLLQCDMNTKPNLISRPGIVFVFFLSTYLDSFATLEDRYPELVAVSGSGRASKYKVDFWEQEREQMSLLTRASEIAPGVWVRMDPCVIFVSGFSTEEEDAERV